MQGYEPEGWRQLEEEVAAMATVCTYARRSKELGDCSLERRKTQAEEWVRDS
jgi:hypothetical protein